MGIAASHIRSPADFLPTSGVGHSLYTTATGPSVGGSQPTSKRASIGVQPAPNGTTVSTNQKLHSRKLPDPVAQRPHQTLPGAGTGPGASPSIIAPLNLAPVPGTSRRPSASASTNTPPLSKPRGLPDAPVGNGGETQDGVPTPNPNGRHVMNGPRAGNPTQPFPSPLSAPFATLPQPQPQPQPPHSTPSSSMPVDKQSRRTSRPPLPTPPTHATPYVAPVPIPQPPASIAPVVFDKEVSSSPEEGRLKVQRMDTTSSVSGRSDDDASAVPAVPSTTDATDDLSALSPEEAKRLKREAKEQRRREREQRRRLRAEKKAAAAAYAELQTQAQVQTQELAPRAAESLPVEAPPALQIAAISSGEAAVTAPSSPSVEPSELVQDEQAGKEEVAAPVDDTPKPPAITMAELLSYPPVFANLLSFFSFYDWCNLSATTREIRVLLVNVKDLKEVALERFLKTVGYARWAFPEPEPLALTLQVIYYPLNVLLLTNTPFRISATTCAACPSLLMSMHALRGCMSARYLYIPTTAIFRYPTSSGHIHPHVRHTTVSSFGFVLRQRRRLSSSSSKPRRKPKHTLPLHPSLPLPPLVHPAEHLPQPCRCILSLMLAKTLSSTSTGVKFTFLSTRIALKRISISPSGPLCSR